jgi:TonB-dependent starch-binding outer membrane protein SusC
MKKFILICFSVALAVGVVAQERMVSGRVTSQEDGSAIPGVNVVVKGTATGAATDVDGNYTVSVQSDDAILVFTFIGFSTQEIPVGSQSTIDVQLAPDAQQLTEVVIMGYREESKRAITGSVNTVNAKAIQDVPIASIDQILQGRSPGVLVMGSSGQPGAAANVTIRGIGSISAARYRFMCWTGYRLIRLVSIR